MKELKTLSWIILDNPGKPNVITSVLLRERLDAAKRKVLKALHHWL